MKKIAISTTTFGEYDQSPLELFKQRGYEIALNFYGRKLKGKELQELAVDAVGLIAGTEKITREVLSSLHGLKVISRCGVGIDSIDLKEAKRLGIKVFNTPDVPTLPVAELTVGLILNLLRKISRMDRDIRSDKWEKLVGNLLCGKTVGIIGFGRIGKKVAQLLKAFDCTIRYYDIQTKGNRQIGGENEENAEFMELDYLLVESDIVTIHTSSKEQIIGKQEVKCMKKGSWLINVSRGGVVDEEALYHALKEGHLAGAALDVFEQEPYKGNLKELDNVILTPHVGSYAKEARIKMEIEAAENLLKGLEVT
jgi:D-3-phosphoglycerate dehydrogenase